MSSDHPPGLDLDQLRGHLDRERPGLVGGPLTARLIEGGRSNLTYAVTDGAARWVVRRPPLGPRAGHRARHGARAPGDQRAAPRPPSRCRAPVLLCEDDAVHRGAVLRDGVRRRHAVPHRRRAGRRWAPSAPAPRSSPSSTPSSTCTRWTRQAVGLGDFGRPEGFLDRQLRRWGKQLDASRSRELAGIDELHAALGATPCPPPPRRPSCTATTGSTTS